MKDTLIGRKVRFDLKHVSASEFLHPATEAQIAEIQDCDGNCATVTGLACCAGDDKDERFYDLEFSDGYKLDAVSGIHLTAFGEPVAAVEEAITITLTPEEAEELRDAADKPWQRSAQYMLRKLADKLP